MADPISNADLKAIWSRNELAARKTPSGRPSKREAKMTIVEFDAVFARLAENDATIATLRAEATRLRGELARVEECLLDAAAHLVGAASAYRKHASRHISQGRALPDPMFGTRALDFDKAADRATAAIRALEPRHD